MTEQVSELKHRLTLSSSARERLSMIRDILREEHRLRAHLDSALIDEGLRHANALRDVDAIAEMLYYKGIGDDGKRYGDGSLQDLELAYEMKLSGARHSGVADVALAIAGHHYGQGSVGEAMRWYGSAHDHAREANDLLTAADALSALGGIALKIGDFTKALDYYLQALALVGEGEASESAAVLLTSIANVHALTRDYAGALDYYSRALDAARAVQSRYQEVRVLANLASLHNQIGDAEIALRYALTALTIYQALDDRESVSQMLMTIGGIHERSGELDMALQSHLKAYDVLDEGSDEQLRAAVLQNIGRLYCETGELTGAQLIFEQALAIAQQLNDRRLQFQLHDSLSVVHERLGDYRRALMYHRHYARLKDELAGEEKQKELAKLQVRYDIEKADREREILQLKAEELENRMRQKEAELTGMALSMVQKNEVINEVKEKIAGLGKKKEGGDGEAMQKILRELESGADAEKAWKAFERQLDNTHHDFVRRLSERFPTLAPMELKICSLLKIDLKTKEIASLLCLSPRTVETHRYNITKKLDLPDGVRLTGFIAGI